MQVHVSIKDLCIWQFYNGNGFYMNEAARKILSRLSTGGIELENSRKFADLKAIDPLKIFRHTVDYKIDNYGHEIPTRIYYPSFRAMENDGQGLGALLFFHGGGWVTESVENYNKACARLAQTTNQLVISVDYRLAPEYPFPIGLEDCYTVAREVYRTGLALGIEADKITLIGDSAGGNLVSAVSLLAKKRKDFAVKRQILIYPVENNDYSENSPYESVHTNGKGYLLTAKKMQDYVKMYIQKEDDINNPYFAPLLCEDVSGQPDTLVVTAEFDPLRDEGEAYAKKLEDAGNKVTIKRISGAMHGYFALGITSRYLTETFQAIKEFLGQNEGENDGKLENN
ncbi:MAG: alpha/beta hydrolase [Eubacteriales bacterium]|nr:alpha/beta hydrolase [Eubacteriales bacterium]